MCRRKELCDVKSEGVGESFVSNMSILLGVRDK